MGPGTRNEYNVNGWAPGTPGINIKKVEKSAFQDFLDVGQYFAYKRYFNTIIRPWDLSRIVEHGRLYILTEDMNFGLVWPGPVRVQSGSGPGPAQNHRKIL